MTFEELDWARQCERRIRHPETGRKFKVVAVVPTGTASWDPECGALALIQARGFAPVWERGCVLRPAP